MACKKRPALANLGDIRELCVYVCVCVFFLVILLKANVTSIVEESQSQAAFLND